MFGPDAWAKRSEGVGPYKRQMTMKSVADIFGEQGLVCQPANDDRLNGWQNLRDLMYWDANIQPKFFVLESCTNVRECLPAMIHDEHKVEDMKAHKRDHLPDAIRYVCMHTVDSVRPHQSVIDRAMLLGEFDAAADVSRTTGLVFLVAAILAFSIFLVFFTLLGSSPAFAARMEGLLNIVPAGPRPKVKGFYWTFVAGLAVLNSPSKHLALFVYSLPVWLLEGSMYFMLAYSFGIDEHFDSVGVLLLVVLLLTATSNLATAVPSAIGGIGPFEIVAQQTLMALGVGASLAGAYSGFVHLVALWLPVNLVGLVILWKNNLSLREMSAASRAGSLEPTSGLAGETSGEHD